MNVWFQNFTTTYIESLKAPILFHASEDSVLYRLATNTLEMVDIYGLFIVAIFFVIVITFSRNTKYTVYIKSVFPFNFPTNTNIKRIKALITVRPFYTLFLRISKYFN